MRSNGGMMSVAAAKDLPLATVMSGPAGGVAACRYLSRKIGIPNAIAFDMGGTSTDVCLIANGEATVANQRHIGGQPFRMPTVAVESIGAGGGSIARVDLAGALKVGPESAGADPGPACYGLGGSEPTVTDANLVLGYLNPEAVLGRRIRLDRRRSEEALRALADRFGYSVRQMAEGILAVANSNMIRAIRLVSVQKGFDVRDFALIAFGGAGPIHAGRLARELGIPKVVVPAFSSVFSAFGCLVSDLRYDAVQTHKVRLDEAPAEQLEALVADMVSNLGRRLARDGYDSGDITWRRSLDVRYVGQKYELEVPLSGDDGSVDFTQVREDFNRVHRMNFSYATGEALELVNVRVSAVVPTNHPDLPRLRAANGDGAQVGERQAYFGELGEVTTPVYNRDRLAAEQRLRGPAIVEDEWSTVVVYPGQTLAVDEYGNLLLEVGS
jgi:N-methylhydantoinase A